MTGAQILDDVEAMLGEFVAFPAEAARVAVTLWAAHAHAVDCFDSSPRLVLLSPEPGSGKTRVLEVLELLVPHPMHSLSASAPAIFRTIAAERPTLLFDEVDALFGRSGRDENHEDLRGLLNAGHRAGATIPRCVGPTHEVRQFPVFCAVALAGLGDLPDTLMTRSVVVRMRRRRPGEHVQPYRYRVHSQAGYALRDALADWCNTVSDSITNAWPAMPPGIEDRPADVWEPLLAIADAAGGTWPDRARSACVALAGASVSREASLGIRLLTDLRTVFGEADKMSTNDVLSKLHAIEESPWGDLRGRPLDARGLAWRLGHYEISSTKVRLGDATAKGYRAEDLYDAWQRYVPPTGQGEQGEQGERARSAAPESVPHGDDHGEHGERDGATSVPHVPPADPDGEHDPPPLTSDVPPVPLVPLLSGGVDRSGRCSICGDPCPGYMTTHPSCEPAEATS